MRRFLAGIAKKVLPQKAVDVYRRRHALRRYLRSLSYDIYDRDLRLRLEELEGTLLVRRPDVTERIIKDIVDRTDVVLQEMHRQIEGLRARHDGELRELREEVERLRSAIQELHDPHSVGQPASD